MQYVLLRYRQKKSKIQEFSIFSLLNRGTCTFGHCSVTSRSFMAYKTRFHTKRALLKLLLLRGLFRATCAEKELIITRRVNIEL